MNDLQVRPTTSTAHPPALIAASPADAPRGQEVLAFRLASEEYAIPLLCVQEIRSYQAPTRLAGAQSQWLGVIDLRGEVVPLLDLRRRLGLPAADFDAMTVIIVVNIAHRCVGVVADQVNDVIALDAGQIRAMPALPGIPEQRHMQAMGVVEQRRLVLLDIQGMLQDDVTTAGAEQLAWAG